MLNPRVRKILDWVLGLALLLLGAAGWLLPVLPGWIFVLAGLAVLSSHSRWARALHARLQRFGRSVRQKVSGRRDDPPDGHPDRDD